MRAANTPGAGCARAGDPRPAMERVSCDHRRGSAPPAMPAMRRAGGKDRATALQGAVQQAAPFSKRFEEIVGEACESAAASQVARRFRLRRALCAIDMRYLERWDRRRRQSVLKQMGVDQIYRGKDDKVLTVVSN